MSNSKLPERPWLEYLVAFFDACAKGDVKRLHGLLANDPSLVRVSNPEARYQGWTGLHAAAKGGHVDAVRLLLEHGADPNAREAGDNAYALHWTAAQGHLETVRALLDAGGDVHGSGDMHELDVIGWAAFFHPPGGIPWNLVSLLLERGARHHIFSAICAGDLHLIRTLVEQNPQALDRRMSRFEQGQTPLHFAVSRSRHDILDLLIELGADLEAEDTSGQTALAVAMLRGDRKASSRLHAAGAKQPDTVMPSSFGASMVSIAGSIKKGVPMINVPDIARTLDWYASIGFKEIARYEDGGLANFGMLSFGKAELMLNRQGNPGPHDVSLWFYTDQVDSLYHLLKSRQLEAAQAALAGEPGAHEGIEFEQDILSGRCEQKPMPT
ncbi:MAG TPA: ankyrin repeat domain-containing protein [Bryobacteraceae bacterium]|nr:ankyrin repeat domain-containing protein [Bryobacteraceae bacterium]